MNNHMHTQDSILSLSSSFAKTKPVSLEGFEFYFHASQGFSCAGFCNGLLCLGGGAFVVVYYVLVVVHSVTR